MIARHRWLPHPRRIRIPFGAEVAVLLTLLSGSSANAQYPLTDNCYLNDFSRDLLKLDGYSLGVAGWTVPGGRVKLPVTLDNRTVVGSVQTIVAPTPWSPNSELVLRPVAVQTTERTNGFQVAWTAQGNRVEVLLTSTSGAVIEEGTGPIFRVVYQVSSHVAEDDPAEPDIRRRVSFGFEDGCSHGSHTMVSDPLGQAIPYCGKLTLDCIGGQVIILEPDAMAVPEAPSVTASPNPFRGETSIAYGLPTAAHAGLRIYDAAGRLVRTLTDADMSAGVHFARWDGRDLKGEQVSSGIYFLRFATSGVTKTQRLMLLR